ncbi:MAG: hypothetical protein Kow0098_03520 [Ignavibacteriaceae bacterium]
MQNSNKLYFILTNSTKGGWFSSAIRFFTRHNLTHGALGVGKVLNEDSIIEAKEVVTITPFSRLRYSQSTEYWAYELQNVLGETKEYVCNYIFKKYAAKKYGYLQLLYFLRRYIWETKWVKKLFGWLPALLGKPADVRQWNNWFPSGTICTELLWDALNVTASIENKTDIAAELCKINSNNFHPGDFEKIALKFPDHLLLIEKRVLVDGEMITYTTQTKI